MTRRHLLFAAQAAVTLALLAVLFRRFDWTAFTATLKNISPLFLAGSFAAVVLGQLLYAWRWRIVLGGMGLKVSYRDVLHQYLLGIFFSNLMPTAVGGDAAKVYYLGRRVGYMPVGTSVLVDRFLGLLWLSVLGASLAWMTGAPTALTVLNRNLLTGFAAAFVTLLITLWFVPIERFIPSALRRPRLAPLIGHLETFGRHLRDGGCRPAAIAASGAVVLGYVALMAVVYTRFFAASGTTVPGFVPVMNVLVSMSVFVNVPVSVNGIGLREQLHYLLFAALGIPKEVSVSLSLLVFAYFLVLSVIGYLVWLRLKPAPVRRPA